MFVSLFLIDFLANIITTTITIVTAETIANPRDILSNNSPRYIAKVVKVMHSANNKENIIITPYPNKAEVLLVFA